MGTAITTDVLRDYLNCPLKAHLRLTGHEGTKVDYEVLRSGAWAELRMKARSNLLAQYPDGTVEMGVALDSTVLSRGAPFILDAELRDGHLVVRFDGLKKVAGRSALGDFHYLPVLFYEGRQIRRPQRMLLELLGLLLLRVQDKAPDRGVIYHGSNCQAMTVRLTAGLQAAARVLNEVTRLVPGEGSDGSPKLQINDHCHVCEFRQGCRSQAVKEDSLSLLRGLGVKEVKACGRKGLFTLTQLAHTFRPRRRGRRSDRRGKCRYHALQALAIRDKAVYVFGAPEVPTGPVRVYVDLEGDPEQGFVYLIGMIAVDGVRERPYSFWADSKDQESEIFAQFLGVPSGYDNPRVYSYGSYERAFIKRMRRGAQHKKPIDDVLAALVNTLSIIYTHFYFPTYSNGLKDIGGCVGCTWSDKDASGIQSIAWRIRWEGTHDEQWKEKLIRYNLEDCEALRRVTEFVYRVGVMPGTPAAQPPSPAPASGPDTGPVVTRVEELDRLGAVNRRGRIQFFH